MVGSAMKRLLYWALGLAILMYLVFAGLLWFIDGTRYYRALAGKEPQALVAAADEMRRNPKSYAEIDNGAVVNDSVSFSVSRAYMQQQEHRIPAPVLRLHPMDVTITPTYVWFRMTREDGIHIVVSDDMAWWRNRDSCVERIVSRLWLISPRPRLWPFC